MTDFHWSVAIYRQLDIHAEMIITPAVIVRDRECDKLVGHYREASGGNVLFTVELWEHYDPPALPPGHVTLDWRRPVMPVASTHMQDREPPAELQPLINDLIEQMRLNGVPAHATPTPPQERWNRS